LEQKRGCKHDRQTMILRSKIAIDLNYYFSTCAVTHYVLDGHGIESRKGRDFPHQSRNSLQQNQPPVK
jgi:hypothetical protein